MNDLTRIPGVGAVRARRLREAGFDTLTDIAHADSGALTAVHGIHTDRALKYRSVASMLVAEDDGDDEAIEHPPRRIPRPQATAAATLLQAAADGRGRIREGEVSAAAFDTDVTIRLREPTADEREWVQHYRNELADRDRTSDHARMQEMLQLFEHEAAIRTWIGADPDHAALAMTDPLAAIERAVPELDAQDLPNLQAAIAAWSDAHPTLHRGIGSLRVRAETEDAG